MKKPPYKFGLDAAEMRVLHARPAFSEAERAAIEFCRASGRTLATAVLMTKLQIRALLEYLNKSDRPMAEDLNSLRLIIKGCHTVGKLQLARKELEGLEEWPGEEPDWVAAALSE